jgi:hypothetical protein
MATLLIDRDGDDDDIEAAKEILSKAKRDYPHNRPAGTPLLHAWIANFIIKKQYNSRYVNK